MGQPLVLAPASPAPSQGATSSAGGPPRPVMKAIDWGMLTVPEVRAHLPQVAGCTVGREMKLARRWRVSYLRSTFPKTFSQVFQDESSERRSVVACVRWAWQAHVRETGGPSPYADLFDEPALL